MTRQSVIVAFVAGIAASVLGAFVSSLFYNPSTTLYEFLFRDWFKSRSYWEALDYFGSFWIGLPWSLTAFLLGFGVGICVRDHLTHFATSSTLGFILVAVVGSLFAPYKLPLPYRLMSIALVCISAALLFLGAWCGAKMLRSTIRGSERGLRRIAPL